MIKYQRNNITFRIASADAIGKFKSAQAHSFVQLARKELSFDESCKEIVLLEYDRLSQWIFRVERICFTAGEGFMNEQLKMAIMQSLEDEFNVIESVMESNPTVFSSLSIAYTKLVHRYSAVILSSYFEKHMKLKIANAYSELVSSISNYLQHLLVCMHEFNSNLVKKQSDPFISVSDFCAYADINSNESFNSSVMRAKFFKDAGVINNFVLKNYSNLNIFDEVHKLFATNNINIIPEDSLELVSA